MDDAIWGHVLSYAKREENILSHLGNNRPRMTTNCLEQFQLSRIQLSTSKSLPLTLLFAFEQTCLQATEHSWIYLGSLNQQ